MIRTVRHGSRASAAIQWLQPFVMAWLLLSAFGSTPLRAADLTETQKQLLRGQYDDVIRIATDESRDGNGGPEWPLLLAEALTQRGRYDEARMVLINSAEFFRSDLRLRLAAYEAARRTGAAEEAETIRSMIERIAVRGRGYRSPAERVALGRVALMLGADPKAVLDRFYDPVRKEQPELRDSWLASVDLAFEKNDFALAAKTLTAAAKVLPDDSDVWFGLARAYSSSDREAAVDALSKTLKLNPQHIGAHLLMADHSIDAENYDAAEAALALALAVNPHHPETHAYRAVLAHLRADPEAELTERAEALNSWARNPAVPHLMGRKLSQKYRFAEGAALQREALDFDPGFLTAKAQLANDLLRLGEDEEGWRLAEEVHTADPYDVVAYNLTTLREVMSKFRTLTSEHFIVRMDPHEAEIYGGDVLELLERAHATLTKKYGLQLKERTIVEIFPNQKDFAIRTFGLPGGDGYLGVCFGRVITANSPAARPGSTSNWQAVLWHEFAHVVTLTATKNKMPRWLSEGISVYEERLARSSWGEHMKPRYRAMILGEDLTPVSQLSAAFLQPKTPLHLGFAYYESSLVVEWLSERWGVEKMKLLLADLAKGVEINTALATHFAPITTLDSEFAAHAQQLARDVAPKLDWSKPPPAALASEGNAAQWIASNPANYTALLEQARRSMAEKKWAEAKAALQKVTELYPDQRDPDGAYAMLARVHRELGEAEAELAVLTRLADLSAEATPAYERLMQLAAERQDWPAVLEYAARYRAVNPLRAEPHRLEAQAQEASGKREEAIASYRTLLRLEPGVPTETHFQLARLLHAARDPAARRHVLMALEEAPRFRSAQELLLKIIDEPSADRGVKKSNP
jgi:tetratricopeptide (TPR) repeat protein